MKGLIIHWDKRKFFPRVKCTLEDGIWDIHIQIGYTKAYFKLPEWVQEVEIVETSSNFFQLVEGKLGNHKRIRRMWLETFANKMSVEVSTYR